jgi:hypothetical protein
MDYFQVDLGLPHQANQHPNPTCHACYADKLGRNWFDFSRRSPWLSDPPRDPPSAHAINGITGWTPHHFLLDWLHIVDLGVAAHACGNILYYLVFELLADLPKTTALAMIFDKMQECPSPHGSEIQRLEVKHFTDISKHLKKYPCLTYFKAAEVRNMVPRILHCIRHWADASPESAHRVAMMEGLSGMYDVIHDSGSILTDAQFKLLEASSHKFLMEYTWLANAAIAANKSRYSVVPKFHYLVHLIQSCKVVNARLVWCYAGEDMVGRISSLAHVCLFGTPSYSVADSMCSKYRVAMHLKYSRR